MTNAILQTALQFHRAGVCVLRVKEDGSKAPWIDTWKNMGRPTEEQIHRDFAEAQGIGILTGTRSGNLEMLEFEGRAIDEGIFEDVAARMGAAKLAPLWMKLISGFRETSPSGGVHLLYFIADGEVTGNKKLAQRPATPDELNAKEREVLSRKPDKVFTRTLIETRGEGGFVVCAPSGGTVHSTGLSWTLTNGSIGGIPRITLKERNRLWAICAGVDRAPRATLSRSVRAGAVESEWERNTDWETILEPHGWEIDRTTAEGIVYWRHPGHSSGHSATVGAGKEGNHLYVFSTSTEFEESRYYSKAEAWAVLNTAGDAEEAREVLGLRSRKPVVVVTGRDESELIDEVAMHMQEANKDDPIWFEFGSGYAEIHKTKGLQPITPLTVGYCASVAMSFLTEGQEIAAPPANVLGGMLAGRRIDLPPLREVKTVPFFTPSGRLWSTPGYCREAEVYYQPELPLIIEDKPVTESDAKLAKAVLEHVIKDFPFDTEAAKAVWYSLLFTPFVRAMIDGPTPLFVFEAPKAGTGKTLLASLALEIAHGNSVVQPFPQEARVDSTFHSILMAGKPYALLDNCYSIKHPTLNAMLTAYPYYTDRQLGGNVMGTFPNLGTWIVSANNPSYGEEELRRAVVSRLDAKMEYPDTGRQFEIDHVMGYVKEHRAKLIRAVLILIKYWVMQGSPRSKETLASFEEWSGVMGGLCASMGLVSPIGDRQMLRDSKDAESAAWRAFVSSWATRTGEGAQQGLKEKFTNAKASVLMDIVRDGELELPLSGRDEAGLAKSLGRYLAKKVGTVTNVPLKLDAESGAILNEEVAGDYYLRKRILDGTTLYTIERDLGQLI